MKKLMLRDKIEVKVKRKYAHRLKIKICVIINVTTLSTKLRRILLITCTAL